jgi:hypothetical protein
VYNAVQGILNHNNAEYIDCLNHGIKSEVFLNMGFVRAPFNDSTIIPEHLDPLEHKYVPLEYNYMDDIDVIIFKGDGDQDRPNRV